MSIGKKILVLRKSLGLSQEQMARDLHVSRQSISKYEADLSLPNMETILLMCELYKVSITELLGVDEDKNDMTSQLFDQMNLVSSNLEKEMNRRTVFDIVLVCVCVLSLCFNIYTIIRKPQKVIIDKGVTNITQGQDIEECAIKTQKIDVNKYNLDKMTMDVDITCELKKRTDNSIVNCYMYDKKGDEYKYQLQNTKLNEYVYTGEIPLDDYENIVFEIKEKDEVKTENYESKEWLTPILQKYITLKIPKKEIQKPGYASIIEKIYYDQLCYEVNKNLSMESFDYKTGESKELLDGKMNGKMHLIIKTRHLRGEDIVNIDRVIDLKDEGIMKLDCEFDKNSDITIEIEFEINGVKYDKIYKNTKLISYDASYQNLFIYDGY